MSNKQPTIPEMVALRDAATPGPWYFVATNDASAMNARYVGTVYRGRGHDNQYGMADGERAGEVVACTLLQDPRLIDIADGRWDENTRLIASAPAAVTAAEALARALAKLWNACMDADADDGLGEAVDGSLLDETAAILDDLYPNWRDVL